MLDQPPCSKPSGELHHDQIRSSGGAGRRYYSRRDAGLSVRSAANPEATATARITKPLILEREADLDFGTIAVYGPGTVSISQGGVGTCGPAAEMVCDCTGAAAARYRVKGTNNTIVDDQRFGFDLDQWD